MEAAVAAATLSGAVAMGACTAMALLYVGILYSPTALLRLPPPTTLESFLIRRFVCAAVASLVSAVACAVLLGIRSFEAAPSFFGILGMRTDHLGRAVVFPVLLTSLPYAGSFACKLVSFVYARNGAENTSRQGEVSEMYARGILDSIHKVATDILTWRNYVVAPLTEEIVFRACMIPLLLCGGFRTSSVIFFSPIFFSLAGKCVYCQEIFRSTFGDFRPIIIVIISSFKSFYGIVLREKIQLPQSFHDCLQLGYTVIFGWYASFLFIRTGNLICPIVAHIFCNMMGLPALSSSHAKASTRMTFMLGILSFFLLLFPITRPDMYNNRVDACRCWHRYCDWD